MIPIGDSPQSRGIPWVTWSIIAVNIAVFIYMLMLPNTVPADTGQAQRDFVQQTRNECYGFETAPTDLDRFFCTWAFQPREFLDTAQGNSRADSPQPGTVWLSLLASMFMHAGWLHILGNMLFLWVFGDNVEDRMGGPLFLLFYLASGIAATATQSSFDLDSVVPMVGASGAVAGVLGAYLFWFPKATVTVVIPIFVLIFIPLPVPAVLMIGLWFLQNFLAGVASLGTDTAAGGVAFFAHLGGFAFGFVVAMLLGSGRRRPPSRHYT